MVLAALSWAVFAVLSTLVMRPFVRLSASSPEAIAYGVTYGRIVCIGSLGAFLEGIWSKVHQAGYNMKLPMLAQVTGAVINVVLDLLLIFGVGGLPAMDAACFILLPGGADRDLFTQRGGARHRADRLPDHRGELSVGSILAHHADVLSGDRLRRQEPCRHADAADFRLAAGVLAVLAHRSELHMARLSRRGDGRGGARLHHVPQTAEGVEISRMEKASPFPCEKVSQSSRCRSAAACGGVRRGAE